MAQLKLKFGAVAPERAAEIEAAPEQRLTRLLERLVVAPTLDAAFADLERDP